MFRGLDAKKNIVHPQFPKLVPRLKDRQDQVRALFRVSRHQDILPGEWPRLKSTATAARSVAAH